MWQTPGVRFKAAAQRRQIPLRPLVLGAPAAIFMYLRTPGGTSTRVEYTPRGPDENPRTCRTRTAYGASSMRLGRALEYEPPAARQSASSCGPKGARGWGVAKTRQ